LLIDEVAADHAVFWIFTITDEVADQVDHPLCFFGFLFTVGNVGNIVFSWALGQISQTFGVRLGMMVPMTGTLLVMACAFAMFRLRPRQAPTPLPSVSEGRP